MKVSTQLQENYENYYADNIAQWRQLGALNKVDNIIALCKDLPHYSILEIGAGEGAILQRLAELNFGNELYALEISPSGVEAIQQKKISSLVGCKLFDGYDIPYQAKQFDLVILSHVLEHVEHPRKLLYEAARVAKYVFLEVPLEDTLRLPQDFIFNEVGHINFYSPKTIRNLTQTCQLKVLKQIITNRSKATYTYHNGAKGLLNYYVKESSLKLFPKVATTLFTYHTALVCGHTDEIASTIHN